MTDDMCFYKFRGQAITVNGLYRGICEMIMVLVYQSEEVSHVGISGCD